MSVWLHRDSSDVLFIPCSVPHTYCGMSGVDVLGGQLSRTQGNGTESQPRPRQQLWEVPVRASREGGPSPLLERPVSFSGYWGQNGRSQPSFPTRVPCQDRGVYCNQLGTSTNSLPFVPRPRHPRRLRSLRQCDPLFRAVTNITNTTNTLDVPNTPNAAARSSRAFRIPHVLTVFSARSACVPHRSLPPAVPFDCPSLARSGGGGRGRRRRRSRRRTAAGGAAAAAALALEVVVPPEMGAGAAEEADALGVAGALGEVEGRVVGGVAGVDAGAAHEQLAQDERLRPDRS